MKNLVLLVALLFASITLQAGELKFGWNLANEAGGILDMKFMPNQDQFLVLAGLVNTGVLQLRNTETGEQIKSYPIVIGSFSKFDFTHDSSKILITNTIDGELSLYNLHDLSLIKSYILPKDTISTSFSNIVVDPIRPYVYVTKYSERTFPDYLIKGQVSVYNYETMEFVKDLTTYDNTSYDCLAISKDGKYLAAMNKGKTYLKVWDLSTFELKRDFCLYDKNLQYDYSCTPRDLKFSELNTENIYLSGEFPRYQVDGFSGLIKYSININAIIDSSNINITKGCFQLFNDEIYALYCTSLYIKVINFSKNIIEYIFKKEYLKPGAWSSIIYSKQNDIFIGWSGDYFSSGRYEKNSDVIDGLNNKFKTIYPNPTNSIVNINLNCYGNNNQYEIYDSNGLFLKSSIIDINTSILQIDLSRYPNSSYYIKIICGTDITTYKVIKEN